MFDCVYNSLTLRGLYVLGLAKAYLRVRDPQRRAALKHLATFHDGVWCDAAAELGATVSSLGSGFLEIELDGRRIRVLGRVAPVDDPVTLELAGNKPLTYRLLADCGLPTPRHAGFSLDDMELAVSFMESSQVDCVVKPAAGTGGGRGVTTGIESRFHLALAAAHASVYGDDLLIEEQIPGDNYRLLYLDGEFLDAFVRRPPTVQADGVSTVRALVRQANHDRSRMGPEHSQGPISVDPDMRRTLKKQGYTFGSVPPKGTELTLKTIINENAGTENESANSVLCDSIIEAGARASRALQVRLAGVDVITRNPGVPLEQSGGAILEVNTTPTYYYHYRKRGGSFPVAVHVLRRILLEDSRFEAKVGQECI